MRIYFRTLYLKIHNIIPPLPCHHRNHGLNRKLQETAIPKKYITVVSWRIKSSGRKKIYIYYISENTVKFCILKVGQNKIKPTVHIHPGPNSAGSPTVTASLRCPPPHPQQQQLLPWAQALAEHLSLYWVLYPRPLQQQTGSLVCVRSAFNY